MRISDLPWSSPLSVRLQNGTYHLFKGPYDALDFLQNEWPLRHGHKYEQAVRRCRTALERRTPLAVARESFIAACLEAGMGIGMPPPQASSDDRGATLRNKAERGNGDRATRS